MTEPNPPTKPPPRADGREQGNNQPGKLSGWRLPVTALLGDRGSARRNKVTEKGEPDHKGEKRDGPRADDSKGGQATDRDRLDANPSKAKDAKTDDDNGTKDLGDDNDVFARYTIREAVAEAMRTFRVHSAGIVINASTATFNAPVTGRDATASGARAGSAPLLRVPRSMLDELDRFWVEPPGYRELEVRLAQSSVLLLRQPARWGNTTAALKLLADVDSVFELRSETRLRDLPVTEFPEGSGVVLDGLNPVQASELRRGDLDRLAERLTVRNTRLVIIVDSSTNVRDSSIMDVACHLTGPPEPQLLIRKHLAYVMGERDFDEQDLLGEDLVGTLLAEVRTSDYDVQQLCDLARDVADMWRGQITAEEVRERFQLRSRHGIRAWIDELDVSSFATVVTLAALQGMAFDAISRAAVLLENKLKGPRKRLPRHVRLAAARASLNVVVRRTRYGLAETEIASFLDPSYPARVLEHIWHEHDQDRKVYLGWLRTLGTDADRAINIRAATAVGFLSCFSFESVHRDIVGSWASSDHRDERENAAAALAIAARHPSTAGMVVTLIRQWCRSPERTLRLTAARGLGASVGLVMPDGPDELLTELAEGADAVMAIAIGDSLAEVLASNVSDRAQAILSLLTGWATEPARKRGFTGAIAFLELAVTLRQSVPGDDEQWPTLLFLATSDHPAMATVVRSQLIELWDRALFAPRADHAVRQVMRSWAAAAESSPRIREAFVAFFTDVARAGDADHRHRLVRIIRHYAATWRSYQQVAPNTSATLVNALAAERTA